MATLRAQKGSALVEAAILFPCLVLILYWAAALTDVMVLKLKAAEALRYSLWETTVFKEPAQIDTEVRQKFVDLRSPNTVQNQFTGLLMYPLAKDLAWQAAVDTTATKVGIGGTVRMPPGGTIWDRFISVVIGAISRSVDTAVQRQRFNVYGKALARVVLVRARHDEQESPILKGGDLLGLRGGNDLDHPKSMTNFTFEAPLPGEKPMALVFDTWKAWPRPQLYTLDGAPTNTTVAPRKTYPVVEEQVSAQVDKIVFFGLNRQSWFSKLRSITSTIAGFGLTQAMVGGHLPDVFSAARMDGRDYGPITILPPERPDVSWAPNDCDFHGTTVLCPTQRLGDFRSDSASPGFLSGLSTLGPAVDRTRYTLPYKINTDYWRTSGGTNDQATSRATQPATGTLKNSNGYVKTYRCRGHYFAGSQKAEETDASRRYARSCD